MVAALGILLAVAVVTALFFGLQYGTHRATATKASHDLEQVRTRLSELEADAKKRDEALAAKRREAEELKDRLKDIKQRRHEEKEQQKLKRDIENARAEIEREMEHKLALAREEAETAKAQLKRLSSEVEQLKSRRPAQAPAAAPAVEAKPEPKPAPAPRELKDEERARLETAEKGLSKAKARIEELESEVKKARGHSETDRRVFIVQKGELDMLKDKFRALEQRMNQTVLERDEFAKRAFVLEKELKSIKPTAEEAKAEA